MKKKSGPLTKLATKRDIQRLERKTEAGFEQLVVNLDAALKFMQKERCVNPR